MEGSMSLSARKELSVCIRQQYQKASWREKRKILDGFIAATGYRRKYAIALINRPDNKDVRLNKRVKPIIYHDAVRQSLLTVWYAANQICSKRLVPFMPELVHKLESLGHLSLPSQTKELLLKMSISTVDRLLRAERLKSHVSIDGFCQGQADNSWKCDLPEGKRLERVRSDLQSVKGLELPG